MEIVLSQLALLARALEGGSEVETYKFGATYVGTKLMKTTC